MKAIRILALVSLSAVATLMSVDLQADDAPKPIAPWAQRAWTAGASTPLNLAGYRMTFSDEFNSLDCAPGNINGPSGAHKWYSYGSFGVAYFASCRGNDTPYVINDGILSITTSYDDGKWRSGALAAMSPKGEGFRQKYGVFSARIKLPANPPAGLAPWPAFWILSRYVNPDTTQPYNEFDILENYGKVPNLFSSTLYRWPGMGASAAALKSERKIPASVVDGQWHEYAVKWTPKSWTVYFDRRPVGQIAVPAGGDDQPMYPILDLALNHVSPSADKSSTYTMYVDWVHVYGCQTASCN